MPVYFYNIKTIVLYCFYIYTSSDENVEVIKISNVNFGAIRSINHYNCLLNFEKTLVGDFFMINPRMMFYADCNTSSFRMLMCLLVCSMYTTWFSNCILPLRFPVICVIFLSIVNGFYIVFV